MYRTKTYIAGDWDGDHEVIEKLHEWNDNKKLNLSFNDAHAVKQAKDTSLNCSIKKSLKDRLDMSKTFILIVGKNTKTNRAGSCQYCNSYNSYQHRCCRGNSVDYRSYIEYECDVAKRDIDKIVVIYNSSIVERSKCPEALRYIGQHIPAYYYEGNNCYWNYTKIKECIS